MTADNTIFTLFGFAGQQDYLRATRWRGAAEFVKTGLDRALIDLLDAEFAAAREANPEKGARFHRVMVTLGAAKRLTSENRPDAARFVLGMAEGGDTFGAAYLIQRLRLAEATGDDAEISDALRLARTHGKDVPAVTRLADQIQMRYARDDDRAAAFRATWADPPENLIAALRNLPAYRNTETQLPSEDILRWAYAQRPTADMAFDTFRAKGVWGARASRFIGDAMAAMIDGLRDEDSHEKYSDLRKQIEALVDRIDDAPFKAVLDEGRSVLLASTHSGMFGLLSWRTQQIKLPLLRVGANPKRESASDQQLFLRTRGDFQKAFLKTIKLLKKSPRIISIAADGPYGSDMKTLDFHGLPMGVAQGPATMAYHTKASTFFARTRWVGDHIAIDMIPGPRVEPGMSRDDWDEAWYPFYMAQVSDILMGAPEDMRLYSGVWAALEKTLKAAPQQESDT